MGKLFEGLESRVLKDEARQARARQAGIPCTTVLSGAILQRPGGRSSLAFQQARFLWPRYFMVIVPTRHLLARCGSTGQWRFACCLHESSMSGQQGLDGCSAGGMQQLVASK